MTNCTPVYCLHTHGSLALSLGLSVTTAVRSLQLPVNMTNIATLLVVFLTSRAGLVQTSLLLSQNYLDWCLLLVSSPRALCSCGQKHMAAVKHLLCYCQGSLELGLKYSKPGNRGLRSLRSGQYPVGIFQFRLGRMSRQ